jgi:hypothetical protein
VWGEVEAADRIENTVEILLYESDYGRNLVNNTTAIRDRLLEILDRD